MGFSARMLLDRFVAFLQQTGEQMRISPRNKSRELTNSGISATFSISKRSLSATKRQRHEQLDTFRYGLAGDSGGQEPRANVG